jgi:putative transcriptional regulator
MDKKIFAELLENVHEAKAIMRGEKKPARVTRLEPESPRAVRARLRLSQAQFARLLGISPGTLQNWEQGRRKPTGAAKVLIKVAAHHPRIVLKAAA